MITQIKNRISLLQFSNLSGFQDLFHFITTRKGGVSIGKYNSFNLGFNSGDNPENVLQNRSILCRTINIETDQIIFPKQTHSATIKIIGQDYLKADEHEKKAFLMETDAVITNIQGICLGAKTADCVPILLYDSKNKVISAVHAGWRGTLKGILSETIQLMISEFGSDPSEIIAGIGPSISPEVYEVGKDVWIHFDKKYLQFVPNNSDDKCFLDLWKANRDQLNESGVPEEQTELAGLCTYSNPETFFSARRDGPKTGRMATGIILL